MTQIRAAVAAVTFVVVAALGATAAQGASDSRQLVKLDYATSFGNFGRDA
jgi:hypothetical protein